jgi:hypothetical protein
MKTNASPPPGKRYTSFLSSLCAGELLAPPSMIDIFLAICLLCCHRSSSHLFFCHQRLCHTLSKFQKKYLDRDINCLKESLRHKDKVVLEQAREIAELKLWAEESYQRKREFACKISDTAEADLLVSAFCNIKLS